MAINKQIRDKISAQAIEEIQFARQYKQGKIKNWQRNEEMYYGRKVASVESRSNVELGRMQEFVHTLLSKVDNPLIFKFVKTKDAQVRRVARLNSLKKYDSEVGFWDLKDIVGKKQGIIYGRAIYSYYADSYNGYQSHLDNVDVYDFLIDPSGGGIDIEQARYMGRWGVVKDKKELKAGVKEGLYLKGEVEALLDGSGNANQSTQEETNKKYRIQDQNIWLSQKEAYSTTDKYKFWEWYTTFEGDRYYLLIDANGRAIRVEYLEDIFKLKYYPFWTWAAFPDLTEFWTPSYCDYVRDMFLAQNVSINQMLDNSEQINKPQKLVNVSALENLAELKYRRDGLIKTKGDYDASRAIQIIRPPAINTPIEVFNILEGIQEKASGVTAASKGASDEDKVGIYEGNQANAADRFGLLNKSYAFGYKRFANLYECGVKEYLTKKIAIDIIGIEGIEQEEVSYRDIYRKNEKFGIIVEASNAELQVSQVEQKNKLTFLTVNSQNPVQNQKKAYEIGAGIAGYTEDEIKLLMDTEYGNAWIIGEAHRDIEALLDGKRIKPNQHANIAYKQKFVDYMQDHQEDMSDEQFVRITQYLVDLEQTIISNQVRQMNQEFALEQTPVTKGQATEESTIEIKPSYGPTNPVQNTGAQY